MTRQTKMRLAGWAILSPFILAFAGLFVWGLQTATGRTWIAAALIAIGITLAVGALVVAVLFGIFLIATGGDQ